MNEASSAISDLEPWQRRVIADSIEAQMLSDRALLDSRMQDLQLASGQVRSCFQAGRGETIVFVPILREVNFVYAPLIANFSATHHTITYEPGVRRDRPFSVQTRAEEIMYVLDALGIERAHLVAWSDVGAAAYEFARVWPARCRSLVLLCLPDRYVLPPLLTLLAGLLRHLPIENLTPDFVMRYILSGYLRGPCIPHQLISAYARQIPHLTALYKYSILPNLYQHLPVAGEVKTRATVITGALDALATAAQAERLAKLLPNAQQAVVIEGGEHMLPFTQSTEVNHVMESFYGVVD